MGPLDRVVPLSAFALSIHEPWAPFRPWFKAEIMQITVLYKTWNNKQPTAGFNMPIHAFFRTSNLTREVGHTDLVFGGWSGFSSRSVHGRLQVSVCSSYDLVNIHIHTHTHRERDSILISLGSASWAKIKNCIQNTWPLQILAALATKRAICENIEKHKSNGSSHIFYSDHTTHQLYNICANALQVVNTCAMFVRSQTEQKRAKNQP